MSEHGLGDEFRIPVRCYTRKVKLLRTKTKIQIRVCNQRTNTKQDQIPMTSLQSASCMKLLYLYRSDSFFSLKSSNGNGTPVYYVGSGYGTGTGILSCKSLRAEISSV